MDVLDGAQEFGTIDVALDDGSTIQAIRLSDVKVKYLVAHGTGASKERAFDRDLKSALAGELVAATGEREHRFVWPLAPAA